MCNLKTDEKESYCTEMTYRCGNMKKDTKSKGDGEKYKRFY